MSKYFAAIYLWIVWNDVENNEIRTGVIEIVNTVRNDFSNS